MDGSNGDRPKMGAFLLVSLQHELDTGFTLRITHPYGQDTMS